MYTIFYTPELFMPLLVLTIVAAYCWWALYRERPVAKVESPPMLKWLDRAILRIGSADAQGQRRLSLENDSRVFVGVVEDAPELAVTQPGDFVRIGYAREDHLSANVVYFANFTMRDRQRHMANSTASV